MLIKLKTVIHDAALSLSAARRIVSTKAKGTVDRQMYGLQFSDYVYYCMSQGLLDSKTLEMIQNRRTIDEVVMAPSYILRDTWQQDESHSFGHFLGLSLSNLLERDNSEKSALQLDD